MYEIQKSELAFYGERQRKGEILISGMSVTQNGYKLQIVETPRMADAQKIPPLPAVQPIKTQPEPAKAQETPSQETPSCPFCTAPLELDGTCSICNRMAKIAGAAEERRRAWHLFKRGEGPRPI